MPRVYIETSIVSYLRQRPSGQVVAAARQHLTRRWWDEERRSYELVTSQYVLDEAGRGAPELAEARLNLLNSVPLLELHPAIDDIAAAILTQSVLPPSAQVDALHIATAAYHEIDYLLTWNCTHLANAKILRHVNEILDARGCFVPTICTPEEMVSHDD